MKKLLKLVEKPIRYTGEEINMCKKDPSKVKCRFAFCFPDVYEIGMSHLWLRILYDLYIICLIFSSLSITFPISGKSNRLFILLFIS